MNPKGSTPTLSTPNIFHRSVVECDILLLLEAFKNGDYDQTTLLASIVTSLVNLMTRFLWDRMKEEMALAETKPNTPPPDESGQNMQDAVRDEFDRKLWLTAWQQPFRGQVLESLEMKLQLNVYGLQSNQERSRGMSRIIPIVQSSGTGKSRLAEEYNSPDAYSKRM